jgi:hypothetical protein
MKILILFILAMIETISYAATDEEVIKELHRAEKELSKNLPSGNANHMTIGVRAGPGKRLTYSSVQSVPASEWTDSMKSHSLRIAINDYCTNPGMTFFRKNNVTVTWTLSDTEGRHVTSNTVSSANCR